MELRTVDPRRLRDNPDNPRRSGAPQQADAQLAASIQAIGLIQPPIVTERDGELVIVAGHRRVRGAITAGLAEIGVLVNGGDPTGMAALSENVVRAQLNPVDQWRGIERLEAGGWNEQGIATALALPVRTVRKLKLLAHVHKPMLERMAKGEMPREDDLRVIATAPAEEQAAAWKRYRPRKGEPTSWSTLRHALEKRRFLARHARFGEAEAEAFGIVWQEDLFAPADEDGRATTDGEAFLAAQRAWLAANLPSNGVLLEEDEYGRGQLPPHAERVWGEAREGDLVGYHVSPTSGEIGSIVFRLPGPRPRQACRGGDAAPSRTRPAISRKGQDLIGDLRTEALHHALCHAPIEDDTLLAMLVTAFAGDNVQVRSGSGRSAYGSACQSIAAGLTADGSLGHDPELLRQAARAMLVEVLSCRSGQSSSGTIARLAGVAIGADHFLPSMASAEFLGCLSKSALNEAARASGLVPHQKARDTRSALSSHYRQAAFVHPIARFALTPAELAEVAGQEQDVQDGPEEAGEVQEAEGGEDETAEAEEQATPAVEEDLAVA